MRNPGFQPLAGPRVWRSIRLHGGAPGL